MQFSKIPPTLMGFNTLQKQLWEGRGGRKGGVGGGEGNGGRSWEWGRRRGNGGRSGEWGRKGEEGGRREVGRSWGLDACALWVFSALVCSFL